MNIKNTLPHINSTIYSEEESVDTYEEKHILAVRPSISLAKNIKRRDPVFSLVNREVIEGICATLFTD